MKKNIEWNDLFLCHTHIHWAFINPFRPIHHVFKNWLVNLCLFCELEEYSDVLSVTSLQYSIFHSLESDSELLLINCIDMLIKTITIYRLSRKKLYPTDKILLASYRLSCAWHSGATALREESSSAKETARECLYAKQKLKATTTSAVSFLLEQSVQAKLEETIRHLWWRLACASSTDTLKHVLYSFTAVADDTTQAYRSCIVSSDLVCIST